MSSFRVIIVLCVFFSSFVQFFVDHPKSKRTSQPVWMKVEEIKFIPLKEFLIMFKYVNNEYAYEIHFIEHR